MNIEKFEKPKLKRGQQFELLNEDFKKHVVCFNKEEYDSDTDPTWGKRWKQKEEEEKLKKEEEKLKKEEEKLK